MTSSRSRRGGDLGISDLFFESREPPEDELSIVDLESEFPEGACLVGGVDFEGVPRVATAEFTHVIPSEPVITSPELAENEEEATGMVVDRSSLVVSGTR